MQAALETLLEEQERRPSSATKPGFGREGETGAIGTADIARANARVRWLLNWLIRVYEAPLVPVSQRQEEELGRRVGGTLAKLQPLSRLPLADLRPGPLVRGPMALPPSEDPSLLGSSSGPAATE